jgi:hypothetical protein
MIIDNLERLLSFWAVSKIIASRTDKIKRKVLFGLHCYTPEMQASDMADARNPPAKNACKQRFFME